MRLAITGGDRSAGRPQERHLCPRRIEGERERHPLHRGVDGYRVLAGLAAQVSERTARQHLAVRSERRQDVEGLVEAARGALGPALAAPHAPESTDRLADISRAVAQRLSSVPGLEAVRSEAGTGEQEVTGTDAELVLP